LGENLDQYRNKYKGFIYKQIKFANRGGSAVEHFFAKVLSTMAALLVAAYLLPGITVTGIWAGFFAAVVLGFVNGFIRPIFTILTIPFTIITFGLFLLVINAIMLSLTSVLVPGFYVNGFLSALMGSIIVSFVSSILHNLFEQ
jgi:putative membrane protein